MNNFNYNNYIGENMDEPLRIEFKSNTSYTTKSGIYELGGVFTHEDRRIKEWFLLLRDEKNYYHNIEGDTSCKPLIRSIADLTDEELVFIFGKKDCTIERKNVLVATKNYGKIKIYDYTVRLLQDDLYYINEFTSAQGFKHCNQQLLNRLYSLHVSLDYDELIRTNKAVRKV